MIFKNIFYKRKYIETLIKFINPKLILTFIDNDTYIWELKSSFLILKFVLFKMVIDLNIMTFLEFLIKKKKKNTKLITVCI